MPPPTRQKAKEILKEHVKDEYQIYHAEMAFFMHFKINPVPFGQMKAGSIKKRLNEKSFAAKIDRTVINRGVEAIGITLDDHIQNLIKFFEEMK